MELKAKLIEQLKSSKQQLIEGTAKMIADTQKKTDDHVKVLEKAVDDLEAMDDATIEKEVLSQEGHVHYLALYASQLSLRQEAENKAASEQVKQD